ncbi:MAG: hypothetical protein QNJ55_15290 [Xenococcus sp. MO_188.B8]|nr:hypothetical protein [Xenococcus sp. MO_188.B8]
MFDEEEKQIFLKYKKALITVGVDLSDEFVIDYIEGCNHDLEKRFQAIISYWYWLQTQKRDIENANQLLIQAFEQEWEPIEWQEEFLNNDKFKSPAEKWWEQARKVDILKNLIVDVKDNLWSGGKIVFQKPNGELWNMDLEIAMDMSWQEIITYYQRVTGTIIDSQPGYFLFRDE